MTPLMEEAPQFGEVVRRARELAGLSISELARRARVTRGTVHNIENGVTTPAAGTLRRIQAVVGLTDDPGARPGADDYLKGPGAGYVLSPNYDPLQLCRDMVAMLNGPGGTLEQTFAYLDAQSAEDWFQLSNQPVYLEKFKAKIPVQAFAGYVAQHVDARGLDLIGLGVGDGKSETRLAQALVSTLGPNAVHVYFLDISHPLLVEAYNHALAALPGSVPVFPIHGNFLDLGRLLPLQQRGRERRRLWTMFGNTLANLAHEPSFLRDVGACARRGDLLLLDVQLAWADAHDLAAVRKHDPALCRPIPPADARWLTGPVKRHCRGCRKVRVELAVTNRCPLPGSYELNLTAHVDSSEGARQFDVFRARRYNLEQLSHELKDLGWAPKRSAKYGPEPQHMALLLLERR